jgi:hypothetical protein
MLPKRGGGYFSSPPACAGNLFVLPLGARRDYYTPSPPAGFKRETQFLEVSGISVGRIQDEEDKKTIGQVTRTSYCPILLLVLESPLVERAAPPTNRSLKWWGEPSPASRSGGDLAIASTDS